MSLLTVDQIQYNGGTALTLPTATPAAGDLLQTNGSATLSWRDRLQKVTNAAGTVTYTAPSNIVSGKALGTGGSGTLGWYSAGGDPMKIGSHIGWRLADKADFCSTISAVGGSQTASPNNSSQFYLRLPSGVSASNVSSYFMRATGMGFSGGGASMRIRPLNSNDGEITNGGAATHLAQGINPSYGTFYNTSALNYISINAQGSGGNNISEQWNTTYGDHNYSAPNSYTIPRRRLNFDMNYYNAKYDFDATLITQLYYSSSSAANNSWISTCVSGAGNGGSYAMTTDYASGFRLDCTSGNFRNGMVELYYCLNDGT